jgi:acyl carrier protein
MSGANGSRTVAELIEYLERIAIDPSVEFTADTAIFGTGVFDSLALVQIVEWVETKTGSRIDASEVDFQNEWLTIGRIATFVDKSPPE